MAKKLLPLYPSKLKKWVMNFPKCPRTHTHTHGCVWVCGVWWCAWRDVVIMVSVPAHHKIVHDAYIMNIISLLPLLLCKYLYIYIYIFLWFSNSHFLIIAFSYSSPLLFLLIYTCFLNPSRYIYNNNPPIIYCV